MAGGHGAYKQTAVLTANRGHVLLMLYEAAIRHCKAAQVCIDKKDIAGKGMAIGKVHDIISELLNTLDHKVGGTLSLDLERLYGFMIEQLMKANIESSKEKLQVVQKNLETLLEGWRGAITEFNKSNAPKTATPKTG